MFSKNQTRTLINLKMIPHNLVHSVGHSSFYRCIIQFKAKQKVSAETFCCSHWRKSWFLCSIQGRGVCAPGIHLTQHPCRNSWFQCFSVWLRLYHAEFLGKVLEAYYQFFNFYFFLISKVACWPPAPPLTEVSNRGQFVNPEVGMLFVYNKHYLMLFQYSMMVLVFGWLHGIGRATLEFSVFIVQSFWTLVYIPVTCNKLFSFIQNLALVGGKRRSLWMKVKR